MIKKDKHFSFILFTLLFILGSGGTVFGSDLSPPWESDPTNSEPSHTADITGEIFLSDKDKFIHPNKWVQLKKVITGMESSLTLMQLPSRPPAPSAPTTPSVPSAPSTPARPSSPSGPSTSAVLGALQPYNVLFLQFDTPGSEDTRFRLGVGYWLNNTMYIGGYWGTSFQGIGGELDSNKVFESTTDTEYIKDGSGTVIGIEERVTKEGDYTSVRNSNVVDALFGLSLSPIMHLGIKNRFTASYDSRYGTYDPTLSSGTVAKTNNEFYKKPGGDTVRASVSEYDDQGYIKQSWLYDEITGGFTIDQLGPGRLEAALHIGVGGLGEKTYAGYKEYNSYDDSSYPDYSGVPGVKNYNSHTVYGDNGYSTLKIGLEGMYEDFQLSEKFILSGGLKTGIGLRFYGKEYTGPSGGTSKVKGFASTSQQVNYSFSSLGGGINSKQVVTANEANLTEMKYLGFDIRPEVKMIMKHTKDVSLGLAYKPKFYIVSETGVSRTDSLTTDNKWESSIGIGEVLVSQSQEEVSGERLETKKSYFIWENNIQTAAQFMLRERLRVNLGAEVVNNIVDSEKEQQTPLSGTKIVNTEITEEGVEKRTVTYQDPVNSHAMSRVSNTTSFSVNFSAGFTYFLNENTYFDLKVDLNDDDPSSEGSIWGLRNWKFDLVVRF